jgi:hypothetical protein
VAVSGSVRWPIKAARAKYPEEAKQKTTDPILGFVRRQAEAYGLGYVPTDLGGATKEQVFAELRTRTIDVLAQLFGPFYSNFLSQTGISKQTARQIQGAFPDGAQTHVHFRIAQAMLLTHVNGIRQYLCDIERELWVLMQLTHHPLLNKVTNPTGRIGYRNAEARKAIRNEIGNVRPHQRIHKPFLLPIRAQALINHPELPPHAALEKELDRAIAAGELEARWKKGVARVPMTEKERQAHPATRKRRTKKLLQSHGVLPPDEHNQKKEGAKRGRKKGYKKPRPSASLPPLNRIFDPLDE